MRKNTPRLGPTSEEKFLDEVGTIRFLVFEGVLRSPPLPITTLNFDPVSKSTGVTAVSCAGSVLHGDTIPNAV
jgi:hypothetical protein